MGDRRPPYDRRATKPLPREELAPIACAHDDDEPTRPDLDVTQALARKSAENSITLTKCPLCMGGGMLHPEIAATFEGLISQAKERT